MNLTKSQRGTLGTMVVFAVLGIIITVILALSYVESKNLAEIKETGTQTNATVTACNVVRNSDDEITGYKISYTYVDAATGATHNGVTNGTVSSSIAVGGTIVIYYVGDKSVQASFNFSGGIELALVFVPAVLALIGIIGIIVIFLKGRGRSLIMKRGHDSEATFMSYEIGRTYQPTKTITNNNGARVTVPNGPAVHYYKIRYLWNADNGRSIEGVSPADYSLAEAQRFQQAKKFSIRSFANKSAIMGVPYVQAEAAATQSSTTQVKKPKFCEYCGAKVEEGSNSCPGCGKQY